MMWSEPYLETCCRSALHRLVLCGDAGRPATEKDRPCLERLARMGLARMGMDGCCRPTASGFARHRTEIRPLSQQSSDPSGTALTRT